MSRLQLLEDVSASPPIEPTISLSQMMAIFDEEEAIIDEALKESTFAEGNSLSAQKRLLNSMRKRVESPLLK